MAMTPNVIAGDSPGNFIGTPGGENLYQPPSAGLQPGGSSMTPAPWQLPSGGATTPQAAFQNDFATAQDFRDRAIAGGADPQQADATYFAPLKAKWKTIAAAPEVFLEPTNFQKFNSDFEAAHNNFNSEIQSGSTPKEAAAVSLIPVLEKWSLNPSTNVKPVDKSFSDAMKIAVSPSGTFTDAASKLGDKATSAQINAIRLAVDEAHPKPKIRTPQMIAAETKQWNEIANDPGISSERRAIAVQKLGDLQDELFKENPLRITPSEAPLDQSQIYHPAPGVYPEGMTLPLPKPETALNVPGSTANTPSVGAVVKGYTFLGGNPADKANWKKVQ